MIGTRNRADPVGRAAAWLALAVLGVGLGPAQADTLLVVRKSAGAVDLVDPGSGLTLGSVAVGFAPHEISRSPDGRFAAVSNYGTRERPGATLSIIDLEHPLELRRIELGEWRRPHGVAWYAPDRIALSTEEPAGLLVIDPRAGHVVTQIATGQAGSHMVAVAPDASRAFITNRGGGSTTVIDLARGRKLADVTTASARKRSPSRRTAARSGLPRAFAAAWTLRNDAAMRNAGIDPMGLAKEAEEQLTKFPNAAVNSDEQRRFRAALYKPLVKLPQDERARVVDLVVKVLLETGA